MELFFKTDTGWEDKTLTLSECIKWFKDHTDEDGNVNEDVLIFKDAKLGFETDKSIGWTLSDDSMDRDKERFDTAGWNLKEFKKNPVLQWSHDSTIPAIGKVINPKVKENRLVGKIEFDATDAFAQKIERKVRAGYISAGSVGFFPTQVEIPEDDKDGLQLIFRKQELREFSICNVPANPNALVEQPEKDEKQDKPFFFGNDISLESVKADVEEHAIDIQELQQRQMDTDNTVRDLIGKIAKDDDIYQSLFDKTLPPTIASKESVFDNG